MVLLNFSFPNRTLDMKPADLLSGSLQLDDKEQVEAMCREGYKKLYDVKEHYSLVFRFLFFPTQLAKDATLYMHEWEFESQLV